MWEIGEQQGVFAVMGKDVPYWHVIHAKTGQ